MLFNLLKHKNTTYITGVIALILLILLIVINALISHQANECVIMHQLSFTKERALSILAIWGKQGQTLFIKTIWIDYVFPLFYATFLSSLLAQQTEHLKNKFKGFALSYIITLPFIAAFFDMVENAYQIVQVTDGINLPSWVFLMTSLASLIKWTCLAISLVIICILYRKSLLKKTPTC